MDDRVETHVDERAKLKRAERVKGFPAERKGEADDIGKIVDAGPAGSYVYKFRDLPHGMLAGFGTLNSKLHCTPDGKVDGRRFNVQLYSLTLDQALAVAKVLKETSADGQAGRP